MSNPADFNCITYQRANAFLQFFAVLVLGCILLGCMRDKRDGHRGVWFPRLVLAHTIGNLIYGISDYVDSLPAPHILKNLLALSSFVPFYFCAWIFVQYIDETAHWPRKRRDLLIRSTTLLAVALLGLVILYHTGELFRYTTGLLEPGILYPLALVYPVLVLLNSLIRFAGRQDIPRIQKTVLILYCLMPAVGLFLQIIDRNINYYPLSGTLSVVLCYSSVYLSQAQALNEKERELTENRVSMTLSQIQPHFLYNSLTAIMELCDQNPAQAKAAVADFAAYLRINLDSLTRREPVPFRTELNHVQTYLRFEQLRFEDRLNVEMDIQAEDFCLPALTVQPIVENAVKHGVCKRLEGGTVTITSCRVPLGYEIVVKDNGVGFDPDLPSAGGRSHLGIENVRYRLKTTCGGSLQIESKPGTGTVARIFIPE